MLDVFSVAGIFFQPISSSHWSARKYLQRTSYFFLPDDDDVLFLCFHVKISDLSTVKVEDGICRRKQILYNCFFFNNRVQLFWKPSAHKHAENDDFIFRLLGKYLYPESTSTVLCRIIANHIRNYFEKLIVNCMRCDAVHEQADLKGSLTRDFLLHDFFMNLSPKICDDLREWIFITGNRCQWHQQ